MEPLKVALEAKEQKILELLCRKASRAEFLWAAEEGHLQVVQLIYCRMRDACVYQALLLAASNGHLHVIEFLSHLHGWHRFDIYEVYDYGSVIVLAAKHGHGDIVHFLVNNHGFVWRLEVSDAFAAAAARDHSDIVELLYAQIASQPSPDEKMYR